MSDVDDARDAYLQRALRHAPDADLAPPPELSQAILREARGATSLLSAAAAAAARSPHAGPTRRAPNTGPTSSLSALWAWVAQPRIATGFASLTMATLAGVMWWGQPLEPTVDQPSPASPAPAAAKVEREDRQAAVRTAETAAERGVEKPIETAVNRPIKVSPIDKPAPLASPAPIRELAKRRAEAKASTAPRERELDARHEAGVAQAQVRAAESAPKAAAAVAAAPPAPLPGPPVSQDVAAGVAAPPVTAPAAAPELVRPAEGVAQDAAARERLTAAAGAARMRRVESDSNRSALNLQSAARLARSPTAESLASVRSEITTAGSRWQWQWGAGALRAADDALPQWLARVDAAVGAAWAIDADARASTLAVNPAADSSTLLLHRDGAPHSRLQLTADGVRFVRLDGAAPALRAALPAAAVVELRDSIQALAR
jgi:hypothetical protein